MPVVKHDSPRVMVLSEGESLTIVTSDGRPLLEITSGENGSEIRLVQNDLRIECSGQLCPGRPGGRDESE